MEDDKRRFRRLLLSSMDIEQALEWALYIRENRLWDEKGNPDAKAVGRGLWTAVVVSYVRSFSGNNRSSDTNPRPGLPLEEELTFEQWGLHNKLCKDRDKVFAHSDSDIRDLKVTVHDYAGGPLAMPISNNPYVMEDMDYLDEVIGLIERVRALLSEEILRIQERLRSNERF